MRSSIFLMCIGMLQVVLEGSMAGSSGSRAHRVKRVVDGVPHTTSKIPLTSEERRELEFGTESPHLLDEYPDSIYKADEVRQGEWNSNPLPKRKLRNVTRTRESTVMKNNSTLLSMFAPTFISTLFKF